MATAQPRDRERAGMLPDGAHDGARTGVHAEVGQPAAEHGQYGLVRQGSREAAGLTEEQIRGVKPRSSGDGT